MFNSLHFRLERFLSLVLILILAGGFSFNLNAQSEKDPVLLDIAGDQVKLSEFLRIYNKNNIRNEPLSRASLEEYRDLYINFKLKVREAVELKMDTASAFIKELDGYRDQLAEPYLTDKEVDNKLVQEAWDRMQYDIRASHILVKLDADAKGDDTLAAFQKITALRQRVLNGEDFGDVAESASDDQSARDREANRMHPFLKGNKGDLGYFTVFDMVYPFESASYNTAVGEVSGPVRTDYGYHIIKVTDKQAAMGRLRVAHVFVRYPENSGEAEIQAAADKINLAYDSIQAGVPFDNVVEMFSEDKGTAKKGGLLSWFGPNRMVPSFIEAVIKLKEIGEISKPVRTDYGWHIIKMVEKQAIGTFKEEELNLRKRISRDSRSNLSKESFVAKVKKQYGFTENKASLQDFYEVVSDSIFYRSWDPENAAHLQKPLFTIGDDVYTQKDFTEFLATQQKNRTPIPVKEYVDEEYKAFVTNKCIAYKDERLEAEYPDFKALMQEYHDGILLFELTDQKVWSKAVKDTTGMEAFFAENREKYMWGERLDVSTVSCASEKLAVKARKLALKVLSKNADPVLIESKLNKGDEKLVSVQRKKYSKEEDQEIDKLARTPGLSETKKVGETYNFFIVHQVLSPEKKELNECRGLVTADYQTYLEKEWINDLRAKYPVKVFDNALDDVK